MMVHTSGALDVVEDGHDAVGVMSDARTTGVGGGREAKSSLQSDRVQRYMPNQGS